VTDRRVHPGAWWAWALGLAAVAARATNLVLLAGIVGVVLAVVWACRTPSPQQLSLAVFVRLAVWVVVLRVLLQIVFAPRLPGTVLFTLPEATLPGWAAGISVGGPVTLESLVAGVAAAARLAVVLICVGAVNTLATPGRLLKSLPAVLYEAGVAVTVGLTATPQAMAEVSRVRTARHLRGRPTRGAAGLRGTAVPVLEGALDRALTLASSMDARGYGRRDAAGPHRFRSLALLGVGLLSICVGAYGVLASGPSRSLAGPALALGAAACATSLLLAGRGSRRTRYRPIPWTASATAVALSGVVPVVASVVAAGLDPAVLMPSTQPLVMPTMTWPLVLGLVVALTPMLVAPAPAADR